MGERGVGADSSKSLVFRAKGWRARKEDKVVSGAGEELRIELQRIRSIAILLSSFSLVPSHP